MTEYVRAMAVSAKRRREQEKTVSLIEMVHNGSRMVYLGDFSDDDYLELSDMKINIETHFILDLPEAMNKYDAGYFLARNKRDFTQDYLDHNLENKR